MENEAISPESDGALKAATKAAVEAMVYVAEDPVTIEQITAALGNSTEQEVLQAIAQLQEEYGREDRGLEIREIAGGYKMFTKPEHHETIRKFVKNLTPPLKLSMAALETLAAIAYRQPVTLPEIQQIRGVNASGVLKTLLERRLITTAGRKSVIGRPILYKTTKDFLVKFGLSGLGELPSLEEFGELARAAMSEGMSAESGEGGPPPGEIPSGSPSAESEPGAPQEAQKQEASASVDPPAGDEPDGS
jgi:segregation and condensation protein B